jgi:Flp pilus assembly protein TadD
MPESTASRKSPWLWMSLLPAAVLAGALLVLLWWHGQGRAPDIAAGPFLNPPAPLTMAELAQGGAEGPFYPSPVSVRGGGLLDGATLADTATCGRCHAEIVDEWSSSAHRFSGLDNPWYRATWEEMRESEGKVPGRWCAGCHTPALLVAGQGDLPVAEMLALPAADAGVSCLVCHGVTRVKSSIGQADFELAVPELHAMATHSNALVRGLHDLLVRIDPEPHRRAYTPPELEQSSAEYCATCHKAHLDEPVNGHPYRQVMDEYQSWQSNSPSGQGMTQSIYFPEPRTCVECHMPEPSSGKQASGKHAGRSHRFAATNTALPTLHDDEEQLQAVLDSLQDDQLSLDIFAMSEGIALSDDDAQPQTTYAPLDRLPATVRRGEWHRIEVVVRSRGIGHRFPGGKNVRRDSWIELKAVDESGRTVYWRGAAEPGEPVDPGTRFLGDLWVDGEAQPVERYEFWKTRANGFRRRIDPYSTLLVRFRLEVPSWAGDRLTLTARLHDRKFRPDFTRWAFEKLDLEPPQLPIVTLAEGSVTLRVQGADTELPAMNPNAADPELDFERWNDYAFALALGGDYRGSLTAFQTLVKLRPDYAHGWATLGNLEWALGNYPPARVALEKALEIAPDLIRARYYLAKVDQADLRYDEALAGLRLAVEHYPRDARVWRDIGQIHLDRGEHSEASEALQRAVEINPESDVVHSMLARTWRALEDSERSQRHHELAEHFYGDRNTSELARAYFRSAPDTVTWSDLYEFPSMPLAENQ